MESLHIIMLKLASYRNSLFTLWALDEERKAQYTPRTANYKSLGIRSKGKYSDITAESVQELERIEQQREKHERERAYLLDLLDAFKAGEGLSVEREAVAVIYDCLTYEYLKALYYDCSCTGDINQIADHVARLANYLDATNTAIYYPWELCDK